MGSPSSLRDLTQESAICMAPRSGPLGEANSVLMRIHRFGHAETSSTISHVSTRVNPALSMNNGRKLKRLCDRECAVLRRTAAYA